MSWSCPKCGGREYETDQFQATGGTFSKVFDIQNKKFSTVSCKKCHFTEMYKAGTNDLENIFDFLIGG